MLQKEVKIGTVYLVNHTSGRIHARINQEVTRQHYKGNRRVHWLATNLKTGREIEIKSAVKLLKEVTT